MVTKASRGKARASLRREYWDRETRRQRRDLSRQLRRERCRERSALRRIAQLQRLCADYPEYFLHQLTRELYNAGYELIEDNGKQEPQPKKESGIQARRILPVEAGASRKFIPVEGEGED